MPGCRSGAPRSSAAKEDPAGPATTPPTLAGATYVEGSVDAFPFLKVAGTPREAGRAIGKRFAGLIRQSMDRRAGWFGTLRDFARSDGSPAMEIFEAAARKHTPRAFAELEGWAEGSGIDLEDLMVLNLASELTELLGAGEAVTGSLDPVNPGCSTIVVARPDGFILAHNEDGHEAYADLMFVLDVELTDGESFLCLSYPGVLPGNAPGVNSRGIVVTTNFIGAREVQLGVGRYFLDRMILESRDLDEALGWATHPDRAFAFHHVLASMDEKRAVAVEATPSRKVVMDIHGLYLHTNHLVLEGIRDEEQDAEYVSSSSMTRWKVLDAWASGAGDPAMLTAKDLTIALSSHDGKPYSPCRHPEKGVPGFTLGTAVFESDEPGMKLYKNQPCLGRLTRHDAPL